MLANVASPSSNHKIMCALNKSSRNPLILVAAADCCVGMKCMRGGVLLTSGYVIFTCFFTVAGFAISISSIQLFLVDI